MKVATKGAFPHFAHFPHLHLEILLPEETNMKRRALPPGSRHHEPWCAVFRGKRCDCDDDRHLPRYRHRPLAGGGTSAPKLEKEPEDA
jgi:hypothetical protein